MPKFHELYHVLETPYGTDDIKLIGVYTSHKKAKKAKERIRDEKGFRNYQECFEIHRCTLNREGWQEGYVTIIDGEEYRKDVKEAGSDLLTEAFKRVEIIENFQGKPEEKSIKETEIYGISRYMLQDKVRGKEDYDFAYDVHHDHENTDESDKLGFTLKISRRKRMLLYEEKAPTQRSVTMCVHS